jgi:hypothetical protein
MRFERGVRLAYPALVTTATGRGMNATVIYRLTVEVPEYEPRRVVIGLANWTTPGVPVITVDGPCESPHRYGLNQLCIWHPADPPEQCWIAEDGLLALIDHARLHLFKEAYWRETGSWPGPQAPHGSTKDDPTAADGGVA